MSTILEYNPPKKQYPAAKSPNIQFPEDQDRSSLNFKAAAERFAGATYYPSEDKFCYVTNTFQKRVTDVKSQQAAVLKESPPQRLARLRKEVSEFVTIMSGERVNAFPDSEGVLQDLRDILVQLDAIVLTEPAQQDTTYNDLIAKMSQMSSSLKAPAPEESGVEYEVYCVDSQEVADAEDLVKLEAKLAELEKQVGTGGTDLLTSAKKLSEQLHDLDTRSMDSVGQRIQRLVSSMDQLIQKENLANADEEQTVIELYDLVHRWRRTSAALPSVLGRLRDLQRLQQESASFVSRLEALEKGQADLRAQLDSAKAAFGELRAQTAQSMADMVSKLEQARVLIEKRGR